MTPPPFRDRVVLVTGGTGSFGQVVTRRLLDAGCAEVRVLSRDEAKQYDMRAEVADRRLTFVLGCVRDADSVGAAMRGVDLVFHAAALKQVPNCESFPEQAALTNVLGSLNVLRAAEAAGVRRVVCLSTDKAVQPVNAMGMTKALMEKLVQARARRPAAAGAGAAAAGAAAAAAGGTVVCVVRYGNVLCSRGSVVPLFLRQIRAGRAIGVTLPAMTRFLLRLDDAVDLVESALRHGEAGDVFVRRSPACTIGVLAAALQRLHGTDLPVRTLGARPGEKMHETLATAEEMRGALPCGRHAVRIPADRSDLIDPDPARADPGAGTDYTSENTERLDLGATIALLGSLPEVRASIQSVAAARPRPARRAVALAGA